LVKGQKREGAKPRSRKKMGAQLEKRQEKGRNTLTRLSNNIAVKRKERKERKLNSYVNRGRVLIDARRFK